MCRGTKENDSFLLRLAPHPDEDNGSVGLCMSSIDNNFSLHLRHGLRWFLFPTVSELNEHLNFTSYEPSLEYRYRVIDFEISLYSSFHQNFIRIFCSGSHISNNCTFLYWLPKL